MTIKIMQKLTQNYLDDLLVRMAHHSTAIEGNTLTLGETKSILIDGYIPRAIDLREYNEVANYKKYIKFMAESLKKERCVDNELIKETHQLLCDEAIEGIPGKFKVIRNAIIGADFETTEPYLVPQELKNWCDDLHYRLENANSNIDKLQIICEQHIKFEKIHPFSDGNGRVGRSLIVYSCLQSDMAPAVIPVDKRKEYINYLNNGDAKGLTSFANKLQKVEINKMNVFAKIETRKESKGMER